MSININRDQQTVRRAWWTSLALVVLLFQQSGASAVDQDVPDDAYLTGYLSALLERQLLWSPDSFRIETHNGVATVILYTDQPGRARAAENALAGVRGLHALQVRLQPGGSGGDMPYSVAHPAGDLFPPLLADVKEPQTSLSMVRVNTGSNHINAALVSIGGDFGFYRWRGHAGAPEWQLGIFAGVLSQFNLDTPSKDLVNTDYLVGLPLSFRSGIYSGRLRVFHQSSHLGDESILAGTVPERIDVDYEAIDLLLARDIAAWRAYAGVEYGLRSATPDLNRNALRLGTDYRSRTDILWGARLVGGAEVHWLHQCDWAAGTSLKLGLEFGTPLPVRRGSRLMLEAYNGYTPYGQFYLYDIRYYGLGYYVDF